MNVLCRIVATELVFSLQKANPLFDYFDNLQYIVWFGTVNALAQDRITRFLFANIRKSVVYQLRKSGMSFQKQLWHG